MNLPGTPSHRISERIPITRTVVGALVATMLLAGCSHVSADGSDSGAGPAVMNEPVDAAAADASDGSPCDLLDASIIEELIGSAQPGAEVVLPGSDLVVCQFGGEVDRGVQVTRVPAGQWARALPAVVESLRASPPGTVDAGMLEQIEAASDLIEQGDEVPASEACGYFSQLLELRGQVPGTTISVSYLPDQVTAFAISGQQCVDGMYSSLMVARPDASEAPGLPDRVTVLLEEIG